jgi:hypothetical protein
MEFGPQRHQLGPQVSRVAPQVGWLRPRRRRLDTRGARFGAGRGPRRRLGTPAARRRAQVHRLIGQIGNLAAERVELDRHRPIIIGRPAPAWRRAAAPEGSQEIAHAGLKSIDCLAGTRSIRA